MRREIRTCGLGGQGAITLGHILGQAATLYDKKESVMIEAYSPYVTGGWSRSDTIISDEPIDYPFIEKPDILVTMYQGGLDDYWKGMKKEGLVIVERSMVDPSKVTGRKVLALPAAKIAEELGRKVVTNIVILGALTAASQAVSVDGVKQVLAKRFPKAAELNLKAFDRGYEFKEEVAAYV